MNPLKWQAQSGKLVDALAVEPARAEAIEKHVKTRIDQGANMISLVNEVRELCETEEEFASFIFALGYYQGNKLPLGFRLT